MTSSLSGLEALMPQEAWRSLLANGTVRRYAKGEVLMHQGAPGTHVLILTRGRVKVTRVDPEGNDLLLALRGPGEVIGEIAVLGGAGRIATVTALSPCITYVLAAATFLRIIHEKRVESILLQHVIGLYRESEDARAELAGLSSTPRIARVLWRFAVVIGGEHPRIDLSQEELAGAAGLSRASTTAALAALRRQGLIVTGRRSLTVPDPARLMAVSG